MQGGMCYCGIDDVLRETMCNFNLLEEKISDTAIPNRLKAWIPLVKALLSGEFHRPCVAGSGASPSCHESTSFIVGGVKI